MRFSGPLITLAAVGAVGAGVAGANVVLTAEPEPAVVDQATGALALDSGYGAAPDGAAAPAAPAAPAQAAPQGKTVYDGRTAGDEVTVQVTIENGEAVAYVCNPDKGIEAWSRGPVQDGRFSLSGKDGAAVEGTTDGTAAFGTATAAGKSWPFAAAGPADAAPSDTGGSGGSDGAAAPDAAGSGAGGDGAAAPAAPETADTYGGDSGYGDGY